MTVAVRAATSQPPGAAGPGSNGHNNMAKLLCLANWPEGSADGAEYPIAFELAIWAAALEGKKAAGGWLNGESTLYVQEVPDGEKIALIQSTGQMLHRDVQRLVTDLNAMLLEGRADQLTFVPVIPFFELWINKLSDDRYRVIVWQDMAARFGGVGEVGYQGLRFITNRARLMGFSRGLQSEIRE